MTEEYQRQVFAKNLKRYLEQKDKTQVDLVNDLGLNKSTVSTWCNGTKMPRMAAIQTLADYFDIQKSDLIEDYKPVSDDYAWVNYYVELLSLNGARCENVVGTYDNGTWIIHIKGENITLQSPDLVTLAKSTADFAVSDLMSYFYNLQKKRLLRNPCPNIHTLNAAHAIDGASEEDKQHDEDIMNDPDF